jgi:UDP-N-acetylglucosamine 3-dehydrogenase
MQETNSTAATALKVGVVGMGRMGQIHARSYLQLDGVELVACVDHLQSTLHDAANQFAIPGYTSSQEMLARHIVDAVSVTVPTPHHYEVAIQFIEAGIHVLIEKPITMTLAEAETLAALAQSNGVILGVGYNERFNNAVVTLKNLINDGTLGKPIQTLRFERTGKRPEGTLDSGVILDLATHDLDLLAYLFPDNPIVACSGYMWKPEGATWEEMVNMSLQLQSGVICTIAASWISSARVRQITILGSNASCICDLSRQTITLSTVTGEQFIDCPKNQSIANELAWFVSSIRQAIPFEVTARAGIEALKTGLMLANNLLLMSANQKSGSGD